MADNDNYAENTVLLKFYAAGAGFVSGITQPALEAAYLAETTRVGSVLLGMSIAKITVLGVSDDLLSVVIAYQSDDADRIGRASFGAIGAIAVGTVAAIVAPELAASAAAYGIGYSIPLAIELFGGLAGSAIGSMGGKYSWNVLTGQTADQTEQSIKDSFNHFGHVNQLTPLGGSGDLNNNGIPDILESIKGKMGVASTIPSPIILDLDGDGVETTKVGTGTYFDHDANGFAESTGWAGADDGLLVRDLNNNGRIDSGRELFGSETLLKSGAKAANGFAALAELDLVANGGNADGKITAADAAFATLKVWKDVDGDGYTSEGELFSLNAAGVQTINVGYATSTQIDANGNQHQQIGSYTTTTGLNRTATDVWFVTNRTDTLAEDWLEIPADIAALPDLRGTGNVYDLHQAMARDLALKDLITQFTQAGTSSGRDALLNSIIYQWAGVQDIDPASRAATQIYGNVIGDARKLEALEEFMGEEWYGVWCWGTRDPNPHGKAAPELLKAYDQLAEFIYSQLTAQTALKPLYDQIIYTWDTTSQSIKGDLSAVANDEKWRLIA
jgi:hypothetical protein